MELGKLLKYRKAGRAAFTRAVSNLQVLLETEKPSKHEIQVQLSVIEKKHSELKNLNDQIMALLLDDDSADLDAEIQVAENYDVKFIDIQVKGMSILNSSSLAKENNDACSENKYTRKFKLPKLEFRKFGDDVKDWIPFWSQFQKIHDDNEISNEDKYQYLIQATVEGSRSREVIESFPPSKENYLKAVECLKSRFGREDVLVEVYVRELLQLIISTHQTKNICFSSLYDKLEAHLRALETLGVTTDKCSSMLFPLVESCFNEEFLKAWHRNSTFTSVDDAKARLDCLMDFLKCEVENEERINLAVSGFGLLRNEGSKVSHSKAKPMGKYSSNRISTASALISTSTVNFRKCVFCEGKHLSSACYSAQKMNLSDRRKILKERGYCYACLKPGHQIKSCRMNLRCIICGSKHEALMCNKLNKSSELPDRQKDIAEKSSNENSSVAMTTTGGCLPNVVLPILRVKLISECKELEVHAVLDTGSQRSYILKDTVERMSYKPNREETIAHSLFGGIDSEKCKHNCYTIKLGNLNGKFTCTFEALDQDVICGNLYPTKNGPWIHELKNLNISLTDISSVPKKIHILLGSDVYGKLITGRHKVLSDGPVAIETHLGWTLLGKIPKEDIDSNVAMMATSLFVRNAEITDLWNLDLIGIRDPIEKVSKLEQEAIAKEHFLKTIEFVNGRYEVKLPWLDILYNLPDNLELAKKRLAKTTEKLIAGNLYESYDDIFTQWLDDGIIEEVPVEEIDLVGNYLPHRPVFRDSSTTPIRPVFDASARMHNQPSLNQCLQCGPNLIESIPELLIKFRKKKIGVIADIKRAFLQIGICAADRNYLRFLWWKNKDCKEYKVFRHTRVVFGVKSSPFLLEAVLDYHIKSNMKVYPFSTGILANGFYVDNLVTSLDSKEDVKKLQSEANELMFKGGFELRGWEESFLEQDTKLEGENEDIGVLGLMWNNRLDVLKFNMKWLEQVNTKNITKRTMLATSHKIFDPMGFVSPVTLYPKLILRETWKLGLKWDEEVPENIRRQFMYWFQELPALKEIAVPRWVKLPIYDLEACSLHTFVDASKDAYATAIYLRIELNKKIEVFLLGSKSRVAPLKGVTIPRMELLAAVIGARLAKSITDSLNCEEIRHYFWSDSTTVLSWITREDNWSVFVKNRVNEIRMLTPVSSWGHVSGDANPADLPSRSCKASLLVKLKWWEGPPWLRKNVEEWPCSTTDFPQVNMEEIEAEKKKTPNLLNTTVSLEKNWFSRYFSKYEQIVRLVAWIHRFKHNCLVSRECRLQGELDANEYLLAENYIIKSIQKEYFGEHIEKLKTIETFIDENDIIRVKTKIVYRKDENSFLSPAVLPADNDVVKRLIIHEHVKNCHAGSQILLNILRERYWVLNGRKTVRRILSKCVVCKRLSSKSLETAPTPLPRCRVEDAAVFQTTGIDMAGPLFLKDNQKSWIIIFTCAVYRAVHLELVASASTESFLMALRRFISRRGRISTIYCDNGTNFTGAYNQLKQLDWRRVQQFAAVHLIAWKFNPPASPWWGGWWERLIRIVKDLLKKVLGRASLSYEEMLTVLINCEGIVNSRPLTYFSEDETLKPLTPFMFLNDIKESNVPDIDMLEQKSLVKRVKYRQALQKDLRNRFRSEYLGQLVQKPKSKLQNAIRIGDIVLVGSDNLKRINWPLGKIIEILPGKDHNNRVVKVKTAHSTLLRPIQRIYPLEVPHSELTDYSCSMRKLEKEEDNSFENKPVDPVSEPTVTRSGRIVKIPERLNL